MRVLIITASGVEDVELLVPLNRLQEAGIDTDVAAPAQGTIRGKRGYEMRATRALKDVRADEYDVLILPGGEAPAMLREDETVLELVRAFFAAGKPVAAICHGPEILLAAGVVKGRKLTSYAGIGSQLKAADARHVDQELVVDGNLITSRHPGDLPAFMREIMRRVGAPSSERLEALRRVPA